MDDFDYISVPPKKQYTIEVKLIYLGKGKPAEFPVEE
jgi:hypothetical protein